MPINKFYPELSSIITIQDLPEQFGFIEEPLNQIFDKLYFRDSQNVQDDNNDYKFYSIVILSHKRIGFDIPGTNFAIILNPSHTGQETDISEFPLTVEFNLPILYFIKNFKLENFSFKSNDFFNLVIKVFKLKGKETTIVYDAVNTFITEPTPYNVFVDQINTIYNLSGPDAIPYPSGISPETDAEEIVNFVNSNAVLNGQNITPYNIIFNIFVFNEDIEIALDNINELFFYRFNASIIDYIKDLLIPKITATIVLEAAIEFPRSILIPMKEVNGEYIIEDNEDIKARLDFEVGEFVFSTEGGSGFDTNLSVSFPPEYPKAQIGNTGFTIGFTEAKLDLSRKTNIPEATLDGRPDDFIGVFIEHATIGLPKIFNDTGSSTTSIVGRNLIIGTGGISGTLGLDDPEGLIEVQLGGFTIWFDAFSLTFLQNSITGSDIHGRLKIPGFKDTTGADAIIDIDIAITNDGDFKITGRETEGIPITVPDIFKIIIKEVSIGKKEDLFFLKVSGGLEIIHPKLKEYLKGVIDIKGLTIWSDGHFEIEGGGLQLPKAVTIEVGPAKISITAIHLGSHEQYHGGVMRQYKYFGFDGGVSVNPGGVDARGDGIKFYFTTDHETIGDLHVFLRIESIYIDIMIPGDASPEKAAVLLQGYLSMKGPDADDPESQPGTEYIGGVAFSLPQINLAGSAAMRMNPKIPSFLVDIGLELPVPIPLGPTGLGIYGFRSLLGLRYVASLEYLDVATWYEYYKAVA